MANTNKKRTAVIAVASAAALVLSGTVAWNMATDQTKLNELPKDDPGNYAVKLNEDFDKANPWDNKDVWATNEGDNTVIVRMRLEEFYDISYRKDATYNNKEGYTTNSTTGNAIFNVPTGSTLTAKDADSSTELDKSITLHFGPNVMTMDAWQAYKKYTDDTGKGYWVIDKDGWCYYTKALAATESTEWLLDDVDLNADKLKETYKPPYELDYYINVRLQAMSADLADFGATDKTAQWTNIGGRQINEDERADTFERTDDKTISAAARALVMGIENPDKSAGKAVTSVEDLKTVLADPKTDKVSLTNDLTLPAGEQITVPAGATTKTINLNGKTLKADDSTIPLYVENGAKLVVEGGTIDSGERVAADVYGTMELNNVTVASNNHAVWANPNSTVVLTDSKLTTAVDKMGVVADEGSNITISGSFITATGASSEGICTNGENIVVTINDSEITGGYSAMRVDQGATLNATNTTFNSASYGIAGNNTSPATAVNLTGCTINAGLIGVFKSDNTPLTMTNCTVNANATDTGAVGICVRSGDVTLDNVTVKVDKGDNTITKLHTDEEITNYYAAQSGFDEFGYNALQVVLNSYENINLKIKGGSYSTNVGGAQSVFVCNGRTIHDGYDYKNTITVTGKPTFSPNFTFADSYTRTTVSK